MTNATATEARFGVERFDPEFARQAHFEATAERMIEKELYRLLKIAQDAQLTGTIAYLAICRRMVKEKRKSRLLDRH